MGQSTVYFRIGPEIGGGEEEWDHWINLWKTAFPLSCAEVEFLTPENSKALSLVRCENFFFSRKSQDISTSFLLNLTSPEHFFQVEGVTCGGLFLGMPASTPAEWREKFRKLDFVITFSQWNADVLKRLLPDKNIITIPFPIAKEGKAVSSVPVAFYDVDLAILKDDYRLSILDLPKSFQESFLFFAETRLSPSDGFPVLLSEWVRYKKNGGLGNLVISVDDMMVVEGKDKKIRDLVDMVFRLMRRNTLSRSSIYLLPNGLSEGERACFIPLVDTMVSTSHEGGIISGNIFALLEMEKPIIVPNHSDLADILPLGYPLTIPWKSENCSFDDEESPAPITAQWFVVMEGGLVGAMGKFCSMTEEMRIDLARNVRKMVRIRYSEAAILEEIASFAGKFS